ncbi:MAG: glycosyltransferase [Nostoc sp.]|uniref:glycosyltransferase n=1 Tax=Nostoc sp. TaxID=1180 RepID=UPI002FFCF648
MNLFIIPSWYPNATQPIAGIFTKEQAVAIASLASNIRVIVSTWGHDDGNLPLRRPDRWIRALSWRLAQKNDQIRESDGVVEVFNPTLTWNRLFFGSINRLVDVNRRNFQLATEHYGKIDLIHAHVSYPAGYIASILKKEFGVPYVLTEHMGPFPFPSLLKSGMPIPEIIAAFSNAFASIAVSPSLADCIEGFGLPRPMIVPNMIDERRFKLASLSSDRFIFFTLCTLTNQKGIDHLLYALARWNPPSNKVEIRIGGDGPMRSVYMALADRLGVSDRVHWLGLVSRNMAPRLFQECHTYVMPSLHETFGIVYAEAIASGKPVIATRCGGAEFIVNKNNGRLVEIGNVEELAETMNWMYLNWSDFDPIAIRLDFETRFSRTSVVKKLCHLYDQVLRK